MAINNYHTVEEIAGIRCAVVEKKISSERADFLKNILESSGQQVCLEGDEASGYIIGVKEIQFNSMYALYARTLKLPNGKLVTPAIWFRKVQTGNFYWEYNG